MGGHGLGIGPGPVVVGVDGEGQQRRQRCRLGRTDDERGNTGAVGRAHQYIALDGVAARIVLLQRCVEQRHERGVGVMYQPGADQGDGLVERQVGATPGLLQCGIPVGSPARKTASERELGAQRGLVVQRAEARGEHLLPRLRIGKPFIGLQQAGARMDLVGQQCGWLGRWVVAQHAQGFDALDGLRVLARSQLQAEPRAQVALVVVVVPDRQRVARQCRHRLAGAVGMKPCRNRQIRRAGKARQRQQDQREQENGFHMHPVRRHPVAGSRWYWLPIPPPRPVAAGHWRLRAGLRGEAPLRQLGWAASRRV